MPGTSKDLEERLTDEELDEALDDAQSNGEPYLVRRLCLIKNIYAGDSLAEAATRVGVTQPTASRWTDAWNEGGVDGLRPDFGGGRRPKLTEDQRQRIAEVLEGRRSFTTEQVRRLVERSFDVTYSRRHVARILDELGIDHAAPGPGSTEDPDDAEGFEDGLEAAIDRLDDGP